MEVQDIIDFKPISIVGDLYKFRLKKFIKLVILKTKNVFVENRQIPNSCTCNETKGSTKMSLDMQEFL